MVKKNRVLKQLLIFLLIISMTFTSIFASNITDKLKTSGASLHSFVNNDNVLYLIYFLSFFFTIFTIFNLLLQKTKMFKGKPAKVIAFMITVISTGGIFQKFGTNVGDLVGAFHGFTGFILILFVSIAIIGGGYAFAFPKNESKKKEQLTQTLIMSWAIWIGVSILKPVFGSVFSGVDATTKARIIGAQNYHTYIDVVIQQAHPTAKFIYETLDFVEVLSYTVAVIALIMFTFKLLSFGEDSLSKTTQSSKPDKKVKEVKEVKKLLNAVINELKGTNNHFNNKINLLNEIRRRTGNLRNQGGRR